MADNEILELSEITVNDYNFKIADNNARSDIDSITAAILANNTSIGTRINNLNDRSFDALIKISSNNDSEISSIQDGIYKIKYITITVVEEEETETINNSAILIQKNNTQYLYKDGHINYRDKINNTWSDWENNDEMIAAAIVELDHRISELETNGTGGSSVTGVTSFNGQTGAVVYNAPVTSVNGQTGNVVIADGGVTSFNGETGAITYTAPVTSVNGSTGAVTVNVGVTSFNGETGAITYASPVTSVNGNTGAVIVNGLPTVTSSHNGKILMVVNGQWAMISPSTLYSGSGVPNDINGNNGDIYIQINS